MHGIRHRSTVACLGGFTAPTWHISDGGIDIQDNPHSQQNSGEKLRKLKWRDSDAVQQLTTFGDSVSRESLQHTLALTLPPTDLSWL